MCNVHDTEGGGGVGDKKQVLTKYTVKMVDLRHQPGLLGCH
jgi:hypothetical protein